MISLLLLYCSLVVFVVILKYFGESLESVQRYHHKLFRREEWENLEWVGEYSESRSLVLLQCCVLGSIVYSEKKKCINAMYVPSFFERIFSIEGLSFTRTIQNVGYVGKCSDFFVISLVSTANISDVMFSTSNDLIDVEDGQIHEGYYTHTLEFLGSVLNALVKYRDIKKIFITGHSMGGSLGCILGYLLNKHFCYDVEVYTYASPKFGNNQLKYYIDKCKNLKIYNTINLADLVVYKPNNWKYVRIGKTIEHRIDTGNDNVNHGIKVYREIVLKKEKSSIVKREHRVDEVMSRFFLDILG